MSLTKTGPIKQEGSSGTFVILSIVSMIVLLVLVHIGFSRTYITYFPKFEPAVIPGFGTVPFNWIMHFHGMMMMGWLLMLLVQPILIQTGRTSLHRRVGKLSYVLAPLVVVGIYLANMDSFRITEKLVSTSEAVGNVALTFPGLIFFATLYSLAMYYRRQPSLHMRFMISTAILLIPPAVDRLIITYFGMRGFDDTCYFVVGLAALLTVVDSYKTKRISPFLLIFCFEVLHVFLWKNRSTDAWQAVGGMISRIF